MIGNEEFVVAEAYSVGPDGSLGIYRDGLPEIVYSKERWAEVRVVEEVTDDEKQ